jgi:hypothetical protein
LGPEYDRAAYTDIKFCLDLDRCEQCCGLSGRDFRWFQPIPNIDKYWVRLWDRSSTNPSYLGHDINIRKLKQNFVCSLSLLCTYQLLGSFAYSIVPQNRYEVVGGVDICLGRKSAALHIYFAFFWSCNFIPKAISRLTALSL